MLLSLEIRDILIIDRLDIAFQPGLNVLTGETGAGKSILLDALGAVLGWRGRGDLVRQGASRAEVTAVFHLSEGHPAETLLAEVGIDLEDGELIIARSQTAEGRKTARVNDKSVTAATLRSIGETLVELHGQHDDRGLLDPKGHRRLLDAYAGIAEPLAATKSAWVTRIAAEKALIEAETALSEVAAEEDFLRHAVAELDGLAPELGEDAQLDATRRLMQQAERIRDDITAAHYALTGDRAEGQIVDAIRWLESVADRAEGRLDPTLEALSRAMLELSEAISGVEDTLQSLSFDPLELERTEERLFAIRALARKHQVQPDDLGTFAENLRVRLSALDAGEGEIGKLRQALSDADARYEGAAVQLTNARKDAAALLDSAMAAELAPLKMERAQFKTVIETAPPGPEGRDTVTFTVATNPGAPAGPLNKIASGGELSRFLLALKVCLAAGEDPKTLIFDEIDRGVGGATADAVGKRLAALADGAQVLVVTHSPQVAAKGGHHWRVEKRIETQDGADITLSTVVPLAVSDRIDELARMLSGDRVTDAARAQARELLGG
ncbi:MAG: DNA repair protein RecN [Dinoroseobacter sp.]|nr:DNA repair protein RecN [Dinoroseobacter sp.]